MIDRRASEPLLTALPIRLLAGVRALVVAAVAMVAGLGPMHLAAAQTTGQTTVMTTTVDGPITPVIADHLRDSIGLAVEEGHHALVVLLDTPGGLVSSMRDIVKDFFAAPIPVIVYVSPSGADAGSAGTFITLSAHVAAMAPATTIGAATPVDLQGGEISDKVINNAAEYAEAIAVERDRDVDFAVASVRDGISITADEALEIGAIDHVAVDLRSLMIAIDGDEVRVAGGTAYVFDTAEATFVERDMTAVRRLLQAIADPNIAFLFTSLGTLALIYEFANPGLGAGGIVGAISLILAFFALSVLPVNMTGVLLLVLALGFFIAELFAPGIGVAAVGGTVSLLLGGLFLFQRPTGIGISLWVLLPVAVTALVLVFLAGAIVRRTRNIEVEGTDTIIGTHVEILARPSDATGIGVRTGGTWWRVAGADGTDLAPGMSGVVTGVDGLTLVVRPEPAQPRSGVPNA